MNTDSELTQRRKGREGARGDKTPSKPPVGLKPWWLHDEQRLNEICGAIDRYLDAGMSIPNLWLREMVAIITQDERRRDTERRLHESTRRK